MTDAKKASFWSRFRNSWRQRQRRLKGCADLTADGFTLTYRGQVDTIQWDEITRIEAGTQATLIVEVFYIVLFMGKRKFLIDEYIDGFSLVEETVLARWPQIRERWNALFNGLPNVDQHETLWIGSSET